MRKARLIQEVLGHNRKLVHFFFSLMDNIQARLSVCACKTLRSNFYNTMGIYEYKKLRLALILTKVTC